MLMVSQDFSLWYSGKAKLFWREAEKYYEEFRYPESMASYGDSIEFAAKAICEFKNHPYKPEHGMGKPLMDLASKFLLIYRWKYLSKLPSSLTNFLHELSHDLQ